MLETKKSKGFFWLKAVILGVFSVTITLVYGRIGTMFLDQSIVFDGAWRIYIGQIPYKDFFTPMGIAVMVLQSVFFRLLGVTWFSYCLHAGIFNFLFCLLVWRLLYIFDVPAKFAFLYAFLSAVVFYPPFGTAYMEQHSLFFTLAYIWLIVEAAKTSSLRWYKICLLFVPFLFTAGFFSKQIPAVFGLPILICLWWSLFAGRRFKTIIWLLLGTAGALLIFILTIIILRINIQEMFFYLIKLPLSMGNSRLGYTQHYKLKMMIFTAVLPFLVAAYAFLRKLPAENAKIIKAGAVFFTLIFSLVLFFWWSANIFKPVGNVKILTISFRLFFIFFILLVVKNWRAGVILELFREVYSVFPLVITAYGFFYISWMFINKTLNNFENDLGMMFIILGLLHAVILRLFNPFGKSKAWISYGLLAVSILTAVIFNQRVNASRVVQEYGYEYLPKKIIADRLNGALGYIHWVDGIKKSDVKVLKKLKYINTFFKEHIGNFFYLGDANVIYAQTGRPSILPVLWFQSGLTVPDPSSKEYASLEGKIRDNLKKYAVQYIVFDAFSFLNFDRLQFAVIKDLLRGGQLLADQNDVRIYKIDPTILR